MYPSDLRYTKNHEWVRKGGDGTLTVGITDWAAKQLGEIMLIELLSTGIELGAGDSIGTVESVKAVTEVYAPVAGTIAAVNEAISGDPEPVNDDPYGEGWMITLRPSNAKDVDGLMTAAQYEVYLTAEAD